MLEVFKHRFESTIQARSFLNGPYWIAVMRGIWYGGLKPLQDAINQKFTDVLTENPKRFCMGPWLSGVSYTAESHTSLLSTADEWDELVIYNLLGSRLAQVGQKTYRTLINNNVGFYPPANLDKWEDVSKQSCYRSRVNSNLNLNPALYPRKWERVYMNTRRCSTKYFLIEKIESATDPAVTIEDILVNRFAYYDADNPHAPIEQGDTMSFYPESKYIPDKYLPHFFPELKADGSPYDDWVTGSYANGAVVKVVTTDDMVVWVSMKDNNTDTPGDAAGTWEPRCYSGNRPKDAGGNHIGLPARRFLSETAINRKWMLTFVITDVKGQIDTIAAVIKRYTSAGWACEIVDIASGNTTVIE